MVKFDEAACIYYDTYYLFKSLHEVLKLLKFIRISLLNALIKKKCDKLNFTNLKISEISIYII